MLTLDPAWCYCRRKCSCLCGSRALLLFENLYVGERLAFLRGALRHYSHRLAVGAHCDVLRRNYLAASHGGYIASVGIELFDAFRTPVCGSPFQELDGASIGRMRYMCRNRFPASVGPRYGHIGYAIALC